MRLEITFVIVLAVLIVFVVAIAFSDWFSRLRLWWQDRQEEKEITRANNQYFRERRGDE